MQVIPDGSSGSLFVGTFFSGKSPICRVLLNQLSEEQISIADVPKSWISLCFDGVVQIASENAATGGVIRNGNREVAFDGLALTQIKNFDGVMMQTDNLEVIKAFQNSLLSSSNFAPIRHIYHLLVKVGLRVIQHLPRDRNKTTNGLAKMAFDTNQGLKIF
ncbi:hypothetical protein Gotur_016440 [Gossypium turneri]